MSARITYRQTVNLPGGAVVQTRLGTLTGEEAPSGMLRVVWDTDGLGRNGWVKPGTFEAAA